MPTFFDPRAPWCQDQCSLELMRLSCHGWRRGLSMARAVTCGPRPGPGGVELGRVDADAGCGIDRHRRRRTRKRCTTWGFVCADRLVAAHAAERRGGGQGQHRGPWRRPCRRRGSSVPWKNFASVRRSASFWALHVDRDSRACAPRRSPGIRRNTSFPAPSKPRVRPTSIQWPRRSELPSTRLRQKYFMTEAGRQSTRRRAHSESTREPRLRGPPGRIRKARVVGDQQAAELRHRSQPPARAPHFSAGAENPEAPAIALDGGRRNGAEIVVRLHQVPEAGLVLRRYDVDGHRKNHHGLPAPTVASRQYQAGGRSPVLPSTPCQTPRKVKGPGSLYVYTGIQKV